jgi:hypothetical protein
MSEIGEPYSPLSYKRTFLLFVAGAVAQCIGFLALRFAINSIVGTLLVAPFVGALLGAPWIVALRATPGHYQRLGYFVGLLPLAGLLGPLLATSVSLASSSMPSEMLPMLLGSIVYGVSAMAFLLPFSFPPRFRLRLPFMLAGALVIGGLPLLLPAIIPGGGGGLYLAATGYALKPLIMAVVFTAILGHPDERPAVDLLPESGDRPTQVDAAPRLAFGAIFAWLALGATLQSATISAGLTVQGVGSAITMTGAGFLFGLPLVIASRGAGLGWQRCGYFFGFVPLAFALGTATYFGVAFFNMHEGSTVSGTEKWAPPLSASLVCATALFSLLLPFSFVPRFSLKFPLVLCAISALPALAALLVVIGDAMHLSFAMETADGRMMEWFLYPWLWLLGVAAFLAAILGHRREE